MELKEFIKTALTDIVGAVRESEKDLHDDVAMCFHTDRSYNGYPSVTYKSAMRDCAAPMTVVGFKVQVEVVDVHSADGNVKAGVLNVIGGGITGEVSHSNATMQELTFSIPMVWKKK